VRASIPLSGEVFVPEYTSGLGTHSLKART